MAQNEQKPAIRFQGFTDAWEQRKLNDIADDIADGPFGSNLKAEHYTEEKEARIVQLSNIGESGWQDENVKYTTFTHAREISRSIVKSGCLIMAKMMPAGMTIICPNIDKMYVLSSDAVKIKLKNLVNPTYFVSMTKSRKFLQQIDCDAQGSTRTRTSISKIRKMDIPVPELSEQQKKLAEKIEIKILDTSSSFVMSVCDNGMGFDFENTTGEQAVFHAGLKTMRERAVLLGGEIKIKSDGNGTTVQLFLPIKNIR